MNLPATTHQPQLPATHETAASAAASQAKALVEARYMVALRRPRDMDTVRAALLKECKRPSFAEVARYEKPVGAGKVVGPSVRFAEAAIRCMSNIVIDEMVVFDDDEKRIISLSVCDLEANVPYSTSITVDKTIERKSPPKGADVLRQRVNKQGDTLFILRATEDDLANKKNSAISKALRNMALRLVPGDLIEECMEQVVKTQQAKDAEDPDAARRKLCDAFAALNVTATDLKKYVGADLDKLSPKDLADLRALYSAIKDGETTWRAAFESKFPDATSGRFTKDQPAGGTQVANAGVTNAMCVALAQTKRDTDVLKVMEAFQVHTIASVKEADLIAFHSALKALGDAAPSQEGGRP